MQPSTKSTTHRTKPAPVRELTPAETDQVSGGVVPLAVLAAAAALALLESCSDSDDSDDSGGEQSED